MSLEFLLIFPSFSKERKITPHYAGFNLGLLIFFGTLQISGLVKSPASTEFFFILQQAFSSSSTPTPPSALHPRDFQASCVFTKRETAWSQPVYSVVDAQCTTHAQQLQDIDSPGLRSCKNIREKKAIIKRRDMLTYRY